jgi:hypothetical protein
LGIKGRKKEREKTMPIAAILEQLAKCNLRTELEALWTKTYLTYRHEAMRLESAFEKRRGEVLNTVQQYSDYYKSYGWD